ncbi:MAG: MFS transporter [Desulfobacterales bacterium]|nr:MFS transporter [Desulfobacterales bacterium]
MAEDAVKPAFIIPRRWAVFSIATFLFLLSQFYRASIAVITPDLISEFGLDARGLSLMSSAFFYAFAITQIPIGIHLDLIGARKTMTGLSLIAILGVLLFSHARTTSMLNAGRLLMGVGMACNLMGTLKLLTLWFGPERFATLAALVVSIGTAGSIAAGSPLALLVREIGWRRTFDLIAAINLLAVILFFLVVRDAPPNGAHAPAPDPGAAKPQNAFSGVRRLFSNKDYWIISFGTFCRYGIYAAVQTLWAGPYLMKVMGLSPVMAGNLILLLCVGQIIGGPIWGALSDVVFKTRKFVVVIGFSGMILILAILAHLPPTPHWSGSACCFSDSAASAAPAGSCTPTSKRPCPSKTRARP